MAERIRIEAPLDADFRPVVRLIVGGLCERADFGFEEMDDLQLAIERLLAEAGAEGRVTLSFELAHRRIRTRMGPLRECGLAEALQHGQPGTLTLRRVLNTVVDSFGVEESTDGHMTVRMEKLVRKVW